MSKRILIGLGVIGAALVIIFGLAMRRNHPEQEVRLSDGRIFYVEAVTYGTNHVVGWNDWWNVPLRKILPVSAIERLTPARGQSRQTTSTPALIVWVYARDRSKGKYVGCQGVVASFDDEQGDTYPPSGRAHGAFSKGFNRLAYTFEVFPRSSKILKLRLRPQRSSESSVVLIPNPGRKLASADWKPDVLPVTRKVGELNVTLESVAIQTNGGPQEPWEPLSLHWKPLFTLREKGQLATNWESPEWAAEDPWGNRGQTLGLHEPLLKMIATTYPKPEAVSDEPYIWRLGVDRSTPNTNGIQWNTNAMIRGLSISLLGLFPPGSHTFSAGQMTNAPGPVMSGGGWSGLSQQVFPGKWKSWATYGSSKPTVFLSVSGGKPEQRLAVGVQLSQAPGSQTSWADLKGEGDGVRAFEFDTAFDVAAAAELKVIVLEPLRAEFVVHPDLGHALGRPGSLSEGATHP